MSITAVICFVREHRESFLKYIYLLHIFINNFIDFKVISHSYTYFTQQTRTWLL